MTDVKGYNDTPLITRVLSGNCPNVWRYISLCSRRRPVRPGRTEPDRGRRDHRPGRPSAGTEIVVLRPAGCWTLWFSLRSTGRRTRGTRCARSPCGRGITRGRRKVRPEYVLKEGHHVMPTANLGVTRAWSRTVGSLSRKSQIQTRSSLGIGQSGV